MSGWTASFGLRGRSATRSTSCLTFVVVGICSGGSTYVLLVFGPGRPSLTESLAVLNFAQGAFGSLAAFTTASLAMGHDLPWPVAVAAGVLVGAVVGAAAAVVLLGHDGGILPPLVGTVALLSAITLIEARWLGGTRAFPTPVSGHGVQLAGVVLTPTRMLLSPSPPRLGLALWLGLERTRIGLALRAGADTVWCSHRGPRPAAGSRWRRGARPARSAPSLACCPGGRPRPSLQGS